MSPRANPSWPAVTVLIVGGMYLVMWLAVVGIVLWRLWTEVLHAWPA